MQKEYHMLLSQSIGAPSEPIVAEGDTVKRGQMIAKCPEGKLGANLHASVSGEISAVTDTYIAVTADQVQTADFAPLRSETPLDLIKEAGIVGLGGAGFPTFEKLGKPFKEGGIVIANAAECEPILEHNIKAIEQNAEQLIRGLKIAMEVAHAEKGAVAIKGIHPKAVEKVKSAIDVDNISVTVLDNMYPMGEERAIVREVLGPVLEIDKLPMAAGAIVINAETLCRIQEAVDLKKPLIDKDMTVAGKITGDLIQVFRNVPIGTTVAEMFEKAGGIGPEYGELIMGGPYTGLRTTLGSPVVKTTGGILAAEEFWRGPEKIGLLVCACGADKERLEQIAESMGCEVAGVEYCKQAKEPKPGAPRKCENPGKCPGQVEKVLALKKAGAQALLISNCTDCTNTVMSCAPQLKLPVYHCTDGALRAVNMKLIRRMKTESK
ncbi:proline reductase-associated electron transfer protein PrdC [Muricomes intestini]|uniref:proline reductase-associated electron transfer protein PrdC n=1 Tax=Muricomes intestini TaxID=1796634 RepID=UPI000E9126A9|nr:proline reductase-associated electron transfer protein PrdC [Lachnospiraceae bacterium]HCR83361.1 proline reductase-associated electron transfer protein PrdC [Lachnospiraceae bacterium]